LTYQWYSNTTASTSGGTLIAGATSASYTPSNATVGILYYYCVVSSASCPSTTSGISGAMEVIGSPASPVVSAASTTINVGGSAIVTGTLGTTGNTLAWYNVATLGTPIVLNNSPVDETTFNTTNAQILFCTPSTTTTYYLEETNVNNLCPSVRTPFTITTNAISTSSPTNLLICQTGGTVTMTANVVPDPSTPISWSSSSTGAAPWTNVTPATTPSILTVSPSATTHYQLAAITPMGCSNSITFPTFQVGVLNPLNFTPTATPSSVCVGETSALVANTPSGTFSVASIPFAPATLPSSQSVNNIPAPPVGTYTTLSIGGAATTPLSGGGLDDGGWGGIPIGFDYNFFGSIFSSLGVGTNGLVMFGPIPGYGTGAGQLGQFNFNTIPTVFPNTGNPGNVIGLMLSDMRFSTANGGNGILRYWNDGIAPTRRFILSGTYPQYSGGALTTVQLILYETSGIVEVHITSSAATIGRTVGLQDATKTIGALAPGWNNRTTTLTTSEAWRFTPPANYTFQWSTAGQAIAGATQSSYTTPTLANAGTFTYNVAATNPTTQCATTQSVNITVNPLPAAPNSGGNMTACSNATSTTLSATAPTGCTIDWYLNAQGTGAPVASSSPNYTFTPSSTPGTYNYYAFSRNTTTNCESLTGTLVVLTVNQAPSAPTVNPSSFTYCQGISATTLSATPTGSNTMTWYTGAVSGTGSSTAPTPSTATAGTTTYNVTQTDATNACVSPAASITVTVNATPSAPAYSSTYSTGTITQCQGTANISIGAAVTASVGGTLNYYTVPTGGSPLGSVPSTNGAVAATVVYYVSQTILGCEGPRVAVTSVVNPSVTPVVSVSTTSASTCAGSPYVFTATPTYGGAAPSYAWLLGSTAVGSNSSTFTYADAYDQGSNYGATWNNGSNLGTGFSPWAFNIGANTGAFIGNPANDGNGTSGIGTSAFGIYATGAGYFNARRSLSTPMMVGEELSFYWIFNWDAAGGSKGFDLKAGTNTVFNVNNTGSATITTSNGTANTSYGTTPMLVTLTRTSANQYNFSMTSRSGGATYATTINSTSAIDGVDFYIGNQNDGSGQRNLYFNHLRKTLAAGAQVSVNMTSNYANCLFTSSASSTPITMTGAPVTPSVTITQSTNTTICAGTSVTFSVLSGLNMGATPTYAWKVNGTTVGTGATYTTATLANGDVVTLSMTSSLNTACLSGSATANSAGITMTVTPATAITAQPANASVCLGASQALSVSAVGTGTITYQWQSASSPPTFSNISFASNSSAQSATLSLPSVSAQLSYQLVATSSCGTATSNVATVSINQATVISTQPQAQTVCEGSPVTFTVGALGTGIISYQWRYNGAPITGATNASYTIPALALSNAGTYSVVVTATCGSVTSANALLTVTPLTTISVQPSGSTVCEGSPVNLSVSAAGTGTLTYQWMFNGNNVIGETADIYTIPTAAVNQSGSYTVAVTGGCSTLSSSAATVVVNTNTAITAQPQSYTGCAFTSTAVSVTAVGTNLSYVWSNSGTTINNATSATYTLSNPQPVNSGSYTVTVTGTCGVETSNIALITINPLPSPGLIAGGTNGVCAGSTLALTNNVSGGVWTSNNTAIATVNSSTGVVTGVAAGNVTITYTVTNAFGCVNTTTTTIQVKAVPTAVILPPPATQFCIGESMNLQASNAFSYLWSNGATTQTTTVSTSGNYTVTVTGNNGCVATSAPLTITVTPAPTVAAIQGSSNLCVGSSYNFTSATANGLWSSSNTSVLNVNTTSGLVTPTAAGTATITYNVANIPGCLNTTPGSASTTVTINTPPVAQITSGGATTFCQGGSVSLSANSGASYLWSNGATTQTISATSSGSYTVTVTNASGCSTTSLPVAVTVNALPNANILPGANVNVCAGSSVMLSTGSAAAYSWSNGATTPTISVNAAGTFTVTLTGSNGCTATSAPTTVRTR
jgi:hypothetical protein